MTENHPSKRDRRSTVVYYEAMSEEDHAAWGGRSLGVPQRIPTGPQVPTPQTTPGRNVHFDEELEEEELIDQDNDEEEEEENPFTEASRLDKMEAELKRMAKENARMRGQLGIKQLKEHINIQNELKELQDKFD